MRHVCAVGLLLVATLAALAGPPEAKVPPIRLPMTPVAPVVPPAPPPAPVADVSKLAADQWYVIDSDVPVIVLASPAGLVRVTEEAGPVRIKGRFADGAGKVETRDYKGKHVVTVEAVATGRVEIIVVPVGAQKAADVIRRTLDVYTGLPPPLPDDPPKPIEPPEPPSPVGPLRVLFVYETNKPLTREQKNAIDSPAVEKYLNEKCSKDAKGAPEWKEFDPHQKFAASFNPTLKALFTDSLAEANKKLPAVVIAVGQNAKVYQVTNEAELLALLKKHAEGK
jgi:hypothetical protein